MQSRLLQSRLHSDVVCLQRDGVVGLQIHLPFGDLFVGTAVQSCDLKAAVHIYKCSNANTARDFCRLGCSVAKVR